jgi:uncharacterized protein (DUF1684 family)
MRKQKTAIWKFRLRMGLALLAVIAVFGSGAPSAFAADDAGQWKQDLETWRAQRATGLQAPDGWLSLVGLSWLQPGKNTVGAAADNRIHLPEGSAAHLGVLDLEAGKVQLLPPAGGFPAGFVADDKPVQPESLTEKNTLRSGTLTLLVIQRGDRFGLRIKDSQAPTRLQFHGLNWYAPDARYRVKAKWVPYVPAHPVEISTIIGTTLKEQVPGAAEFSVDGKTVQLEPIVEDGKLFFIVRDATSHSTTYGAARFLYTDFPDHGLEKPGELWLDLNRLQNPPCAYTAYATCPLPPQQNRLQVAIPAGEKRYHAE